MTSVPTTNMIISLAEGSGCSLKDDISKEDYTQASSGLIFKGLFLETLAEYTRCEKKTAS